MATGLAAAIAQSMLNALCRNVAWTQPPAFYCKLHTADPGAAGATAAFGDATRQAATFAAAASDGTITTSADVNWMNVSAAGTVTHVSFWSASPRVHFLVQMILQLRVHWRLEITLQFWPVTLI